MRAVPWAEGALTPPPQKVRLGFEQAAVALSEEVQASFQARAREILQPWLGQHWGSVPAPVQFRPLQVSTKAQVYRVDCDGAPPAVLKLHGDEEPFFAECFALSLLGEASLPPVPQVLAREDSERALLLEWLPDMVCPDDAEGLAEAAHALGALHRVGLGQQELLKELFPHARLDSSADWAHGSGVVDLDAIERGVAAVATDLGGEQITLVLGDLKYGHLRRRSGGGLCFVDLETLRVGPPGVLDLVLLLNLTREDYRPSAQDWGQAVRSYLEGLTPSRAASLERVDCYRQAMAHFARGLGIDDGLFR